jgi:hypothetical protein
MSLEPDFELRYVSYVTADGTYGTGDIILMREDALTDEQYERMTDMRDNDRFDYVNAIMSGEPLDEWEED